MASKITVGLILFLGCLVIYGMYVSIYPMYEKLGSPINITQATKYSSPNINMKNLGSIFRLPP